MTNVPEQRDLRMQDDAIVVHRAVLNGIEAVGQAGATNELTRRSPEQIVADLEKRIADVKARAAAKEARQSRAARPER